MASLEKMLTQSAVKEIAYYCSLGEFLVQCHFFDKLFSFINDYFSINTNFNRTEKYFFLFWNPTGWTLLWHQFWKPQYLYAQEFLANCTHFLNWVWRYSGRLFVLFLECWSLPPHPTSPHTHAGTLWRCNWSLLHCHMTSA